MTFLLRNGLTRDFHSVCVLSVLTHSPQNPLSFCCPHNTVDSKFQNINWKNIQNWGSKSLQREVRLFCLMEDNFFLWGKEVDYTYIEKRKPVWFILGRKVRDTLLCRVNHKQCWKLYPVLFLVYFFDQLQVNHSLYTWQGWQMA